MRITEINVKNYRTLENVHIKLPSNYCTLSGHNNAGKSCVVRLISILLSGRVSDVYIDDDKSLHYSDDFTNWKKEKDPIDISYSLTVSRSSDPALKAFIERIAAREPSDDDIHLEMNFTVDADDKPTATASINGSKIAPDIAKNIYEKIQSSNTVFLHNSPDGRTGEFYYRRGRWTALHEIILSQEEAGSVSAAEKTLDNKIKSIARNHKGDLNKMIGRLSERYEVELSTHGGFSSRRVRLGINLKDRNVEVPLSDWGSGTQNRTRILMSILQANRTRLTTNESDRITPIVVVEEPESFLHPRAQAEFGKVLQELSEEL